MKYNFLYVVFETVEEYGEFPGFRKSTDATVYLNPVNQPVQYLRANCFDVKIPWNE